MPNKKKKVQHWHDIDGSSIRPCHPGESSDTPVFKLSDKSGNILRIYCKHGAFEGTFTPKGGNPIYIGKCKYPRGHNTIKRKLKSEYEVGPKMDMTTGAITEDAIVGIISEDTEQIYWKNINPVGPPPTNGTKPYGAIGTGEDILWTYDVNTNQLTTQQTEHEGNWQLDEGKTDLKKAENWSWVVKTQRAVGEAKTGNAPKTPEELGMRIEGTHLPFCRINPGMYADVSTAPFTIDADDGPRTFVFERMMGSGEYELRRIAATANQPFRLEIRLPHREEGLLRFALLDSPAGMEIDRYTGIITWKPGADQVGNHKVAVAHRFHQLTPHVEEFILPVKAAGSEMG